MKKNFFLFIALCLAHTGLAQLKVNNVGNAAIGGEPLSNAKLSFYSDNTSPTTYGLYSVLDNYVAHCQYGKSLYGAYFKNKLSDPAGGTSCGTSYGVFIDNDVASYSGHSYGVYVNNKGNHYSGNSYGFYANSTIDGYGGIAYGAYFSASTATSRHTVYGIYSTVSGTNAGNLYAGYFTGGKVVIMNGSVGIGKQPTAGLLDVAGSIAVNGSVVITSDERLKSAIKPLSDEKEKLYLLQGKSYKKTLPPIEVKEDSLSATKKTEEKKELIEFSEYGYLAQELKEVFPDLVSLDSIGYYSVNYIGLIPVIVEALKDQRSENEEKQIQIEKQQTQIEKLLAENEKQQIQIDEQREQVKQLVKLMGIKSIDKKAFEENGIESIPLLLQNTPNPFNQATEIGYFIPGTVGNANIYIYDVNGVQQRNISIAGRGNGVTVLQATALQAGIYFYTLICDGKPVDTKQMILTK